MSGKYAESYSRNRCNSKQTGQERHCFCLRCRKITPLRAILNAEIRNQGYSARKMESDREKTPRARSYDFTDGCLEEREAVRVKETDNCLFGYAENNPVYGTRFGGIGLNQVIQGGRVYNTYNNNNHNFPRVSENMNGASVNPCGTACPESMSFTSQHGANFDHSRSISTDLRAGDYTERSWHGAKCFEDNRYIDRRLSEKMHHKYRRPGSAQQRSHIGPHTNGFSVVKPKNRIMSWKEIPRSISLNKFKYGIHDLQRSSIQNCPYSALDYRDQPPLVNMASRGFRAVKERRGYVVDSPMQGVDAENIPMRYSPNLRQSFLANTLGMRRNFACCVRDRCKFDNEVSESYCKKQQCGEHMFADHAAMGMHPENIANPNEQLSQEAGYRSASFDRFWPNRSDSHPETVLRHSVCKTACPQASEKLRKSLENAESERQEELPQETSFHEANTEDRSVTGSETQKHQHETNVTRLGGLEAGAGLSYSVTNYAQPAVVPKKDAGGSPVVKLRLLTHGENAYVSPKQLKELDRMVSSSQPINCVLEARQVDSAFENGSQLDVGTEEKDRENIEKDIICGIIERRKMLLAKRHYSSSAERPGKCVRSHVAHAANAEKMERILEAPGANTENKELVLGCIVDQTQKPKSNDEKMSMNTAAVDLVNASDKVFSLEKEETQTFNCLTTTDRSVLTSSNTSHAADNLCQPEREAVSCPCMHRSKKASTSCPYKFGYGVKKHCIEDELSDFVNRHDRTSDENPKNSSALRPEDSSNNVYTDFSRNYELSSDRDSLENIVSASDIPVKLYSSDVVDFPEIPVACSSRRSSFLDKRRTSLNLTVHGVFKRLQASIDVLQKSGFTSCIEGAAEAAISSDNCADESETEENSIDVSIHEDWQQAEEDENGEFYV